MRILVVDDAPSIRTVLTEALHLRGHEVSTTGDAASAVCMLPYVDAVICDGLDFEGFRVVSHAYRLEIPVVLYTGAEEIATAAAAGRIACVRKPGSVEALLAALTAVAVAA